MGGVELSYFNSILHLADEGKESQYQALHSFLLGLRGTIAPFVGAGIVLLFKSHNLPVRYIFLISMAVMFVGFVIQLIGVRDRFGSEG